MFSLKKIFTLSLAGLSTTVLALDPAELKLKIYKVAFSESALCTNLVTVFERTTADAEYADFLSNPKIAENAVLADGTYQCVVIEFSDNLKVTPASASGSCSLSESTQDVCQDHGGGAPTSTLIDGTTVTCTAGDDRIAMYISTASTETQGTDGHSAFEPPTVDGDATKGFNLGAAFSKSGAKVGRFIVNGTGKLDGSGGSCEMMPPLFSFE